VKHTIDLLGRAFLAFIFFHEAYDSFLFFQTTTSKMEYYGLTWHQDALLYGAIIFLIVGGLMVLLGYRPKTGAFLLLLYWVPVTFIVHDFWNVPKSCEITFACQDIGLVGTDLYRRLQAFFFMKNLAIIGGLLMILVNGSGKYSIRRIFATTNVPGA
jgi:putative oxidoreductase